MAETKSSQPSEQPKLSNAELKKKAKAEKQAKRAAQKADSLASGPQAAHEGPAIQRAESSTAQQQKPTQAPKPPKGGKAVQLAHRPSTSTKAVPATKGSAAADSIETIPIFNHLSIHRRHDLEGTPKETHPAVQALGLQMSNYILCGSTARCLAMLKVFKSVIESYRIPPDNSLARHFIPHCLSYQIDFIKSCRPLSIGMGNAIRDLKDAVVKVDPSLPDEKAKDQLYAFIDKFIGEKITVADAVIVDELVEKIVDQDVILTFAKSSIIEKCLLQAHASGKRFRVIAVDSKPLFEGKRLAHDLATVGIAVDYYLITGVAHAVSQATKVFLGAHAMLSDGRLYSRIGTAVVAMHAHESAIPVIVGCESFKFSDKVFVDAFAQNDLADPDELLGSPAERDAWRQKSRECRHLQVFNPMYDLTPAEYITGLVTEHGELWPSAVPSTLRKLERAKAM